MLDGFEDDGDGCVFAMDDEGEEEDTKFTLEPAVRRTSCILTLATAFR